ncbi:hypothetical protein ACA910_001630 [Epithemia clementina (nom. ined.)]
MVPGMTNSSLRSLKFKRLVKPGMAWSKCAVTTRLLTTTTTTTHQQQLLQEHPFNQNNQRHRPNYVLRFPHYHHQQVRPLSSGGGTYGRRVFGAFNFGTSEYASCFQGLPHPNPEDFRAAGLKYLDEQFDAEQWYKDPICSIVNGEALPHESDPVDTYNAMGQVNGRQVLATREQVENVIKAHIRSYRSEWTDLRDEIRQAEQDLLTNESGALIGNQCVDFGKQDGATELEEAVMACVVERRLNDYLVMEEKRKHVTVNRKPIFVHCVSNFSNFLDLSRKVIRSLELGVPVLILGRTNQVQQHSYRWTQLLIEHAVKKQGVDPGMITYLSCSLDDIKDILTTCQDHTGNLYMTGSGQLAAQIMSIYPNTIASTGGPNTMIISTAKHANPKAFEEEVSLDGGEAKKENNDLSEKEKEQASKKAKEKQEEEEEEEWFTPEMKQAISTSASIESAGQCTALRHVIVPSDFTEEDVSEILASFSKPIDSPIEALRTSTCDGILLNHNGSNAPSESAGYTHDEKTDTYWKLNEALPEPTTDEKTGLPEYWRKVVVDYTKLETDPWDYTTLDKLAHWLNQTQPISLAINGNMVDSYKNMRRLFDRTALAVYTVGGRNSEIIPTNPYPKLLPPALTCQARPQECEIFGEVPPRHQLHKYTKYPVYVPSSNPSYDTSYDLDYLRKQSVGTTWIASSRKLVEEVQDDLVRGYCCLLVEYLRNIDDQNPKQVKMTSKGRSVMWGLQSPPLHTITVLRCETDGTTWDACAPMYMLFHASSARNQLQISLPPGNTTIRALCDKHKLPYVVETEAELQQRVDRDPFQAVDDGDKLGSNKPSVTSDVDKLSIASDSDQEPPVIFQVARVDKPMTSTFPMVGQFASLYFPMGHIKSTAPRDEEFILRVAQVSRKWIKSLF